MTKETGQTHWTPHVVVSTNQISTFSAISKYIIKFTLLFISVVYGNYSNMEIIKIAVGILLFLIGIQGIRSEEDQHVGHDTNSSKDEEHSSNPLGGLILDRTNKKGGDDHNEDHTDHSSRVKRQYIGDPYYSYYGRGPYPYPVPVFIGIGGLGIGPRFGGFGGRGFDGRGLGGRGFGGRGFGGRAFGGRGFGGRGFGGRGIGGGRGGGRG